MSMIHTVFHIKREINKKRKEKKERKGNESLGHVDWSTLPYVSEDVFSIPASSSPVKTQPTLLGPLGPED